MKKSKKSQKLFFSICFPIYCGSKLLPGSLGSVLKQSFSNFEVLIGDDTPPQKKKEIRDTKMVIADFKDQRIKYRRNSQNLGYPLNLRKIVSRAKGDIIFLMAQDDILAQGALQKTHDAFLLDLKVGVVTRPYFWYMDNIQQPVRVVLPYSSKKDSILSIKKNKKAFLKIFESVGQLSGLAYRRKLLSAPFHHEVFVAHIYPFAGILRDYKCVFLKDYTVAVGIKESQTRFVSTIYDISPTDSWIRMYKNIFLGKEYQQQREWGVEHMTTNFEGLVQLKNYAKPGVLLKEIKIMIKNRWQILLNPKFWFFSIGAVIIPKKALIWLTDYYKNKFLSKRLEKLKIVFK